MLPLTMIHVAFNHDSCCLSLLDSMINVTLSHDKCCYKSWDKIHHDKRYISISLFKIKITAHLYSWALKSFLNLKNFS